MPLDVPNLDNRPWADLVEDARARIPRFAPRWTDHNVHDPGITFIELFAWLAEMQIYQLNRVGEKHREVFGRLAGVRRRPRTPARVEVLATGDLTASVTLPEGTQLTPLEGDEIVFETTEEIVLTRSRLLRVIVDDGSGPIDQTEANAKPGIAFLAFGERAPVGAELRLAFDRFNPGIERTLRLSVDVRVDDLGARCGPDLPAPVDDDTGSGPRPVDLAWQYLGPGRQWLPLTVVQDATYGFTQSGAVTLTVPTDVVPEGDPARVWIRARIVRGHYDIEPRLRHIRLNMLPCSQHETVQNQLIGRGDGRPDQHIELTSAQLLIPESQPPVLIEVGNEAWQSVTSFDAAGPTSKEYVFDPDSRQVRFGNGLNGQVPLPGQEIRATWYRTCVGKSGNVAKGLPWRFRSLVVPGVTLTNPQPATGGADPESLKDLALRAQASLGRPDRAVTLDDIERLALSTPHAYVARAAAIPNCPTPERITVVAVPKMRPGRKGPPVLPSAAFLTAVREHLHRRRLLCDNLRVVGPSYLEVRVAADLRLSKGAGAAVIDRARQALNRFLAGDTGDALSSPCPTRWPFGRFVFPSEVYAVLGDVQGVDAVSRLSLSATRGDAAIAPDSTGAIPVPPTGLVFPGPHALRVDADVRRTG